MGSNQQVFFVLVRDPNVRNTYKCEKVPPFLGSIVFKTTPGSSRPASLAR